MRAILKQLYDGDIFPAEQFYPKTQARIMKYENY